MNARPIPLRPDPSALRRAGVTALARTAVAHLLAKIDGGNPGQMAEKMFPGDGDVALLSKGAVATTTTGNMPALVQTLVADFIASLGGVSAGAVLLGQSLQLKFDGNGAISIPTFVADAALVSFVREGYPIPARSLTGAPVLLDPSKLAVIVTLTNEVVTGSAGNAVKMVEDVLTRSTGLALDVALLDDQPAIDEVRPAGLRHNISALSASGSTDPAVAMASDVGAVLGAVSAVVGNVPPILIAAPARATMLRLSGKDGVRSTAILASSALPADVLVAIAPNAVVSATDSIPQISVSFDTAVHQNAAARSSTMHWRPSPAPPTSRSSLAGSPTKTTSWFTGRVKCESAQHQRRSPGSRPPQRSSRCGPADVPKTSASRRRHRCGHQDLCEPDQAHAKAQRCACVTTAPAVEFMRWVFGLAFAWPSVATRLRSARQSTG